eukprot:3174714-Pyramimonas_sp.AAC.1
MQLLRVPTTAPTHATSTQRTQRRSMQPFWQARHEIPKGQGDKEDEHKRESMLVKYTGVIEDKDWQCNLGDTRSLNRRIQVTTPPILDHLTDGQ